MICSSPGGLIFPISDLLASKCAKNIGVHNILLIQHIPIYPGMSKILSNPLISSFTLRFVVLEIDKKGKKSALSEKCCYTEMSVTLPRFPSLQTISKNTFNLTIPEEGHSLKPGIMRRDIFFLLFSHQAHPCHVEDHARISMRNSLSASFSKAKLIPVVVLPSCKK